MTVAKAKATKTTARRPAKKLDPTTAYATDVVAGKVVTGRLVRLACERHLRDLEEGHERGLTFDPDAAKHALDFFPEFLRLAEGQFEGKPFTLQPWQEFIVGSLFGWKGEDGYRRFRTCYCEIGKGNGKTPMAAGIGLYALVADGEASAEVYSAATTREQAGILFRDAKAMVEASPDLQEVLDPQTSVIHHPESRSLFKPVSSEHRGLDGKRVHVALIDELHEHPTSLVVDKMRRGTKGRRQALILEITNSGHDRATICWAHHDYSVEVLTGKLSNDSWFAFVCGLDPCKTHQAEGKTQPVDGCPDCDDWRDEAVWVKANPNLGVSLFLRYLREQVEEAEGMPGTEGIVKRLNFCLWVETETAWLSADLWAKGGGPIDTDGLRGKVCYGGLDIAAKIDVATHVLCFPDFPEAGHYTLLPRFWIPEATATERQEADGIPYRVWAREGHITLTPGNMIDQDAIEDSIKADADAHQLKAIAADEWNAGAVCLHLQAYGIRVEIFGQNIRNFTEPTKMFEALLKEGKLHHGDHPILNWMAGNVAVITDRSGNIRPVKPEHAGPKKVDGIIAAVMALAKALLIPAEGESVYESQGLMVL